MTKPKIASKKTWTVPPRKKRTKATKSKASARRSPSTPDPEPATNGDPDFGPCFDCGATVTDVVDKAQVVKDAPNRFRCEGCQGKVWLEQAREKGAALHQKAVDARDARRQETLL